MTDFRASVSGTDVHVNINIDVHLAVYVCDILSLILSSCLAVYSMTVYSAVINLKTKHL